VIWYGLGVVAIMLFAYWWICRPKFRTGHLIHQEHDDEYFVVTRYDRYYYFGTFYQKRGFTTKRPDEWQRIRRYADNHYSIYKGME